MSATKDIERSYATARERYAELGVDTDGAIETLGRVSISLNCWQGDDVGGFESEEGLTGGGILATGAYPGKARTADELRSDVEAALGCIPGRHRFNLHAIYLETDRPVERTEIEPRHFQGWIDWARQNRLGLDLNPTFFSHPNAADGFTLTHRDESIRQFWVEHGIACRKIGAAMGRQLSTPCVTNVWIPDGYKDLTIDRKGPRERLRQSLDQIFRSPLDPAHNLDCVESKLFGIGSEVYVAGSHEFYLGYAIAHRKLYCLDTGHFHPTESVADKLSSVMLWLDRIMLHVSRGVRWDSDHVVILGDEVRALAEELVRGGYLERVHLGLDYFDASINRVAAWVIGARAVLKAILLALLEPTRTLREYELAGDFTRRLALLEELKTLPFGAVWDRHCQVSNAPVGRAWIDQLRAYEQNVLSRRASSPTPLGAGPA
jgi:L-rhamnose isomerase